MCACRAQHAESAKDLVGVTNEMEAVATHKNPHAAISKLSRPYQKLFVPRIKPDLRVILTDYGFQGHPMRKCFPLSGGMLFVS